MVYECLVQLKFNNNTQILVDQELIDITEYIDTYITERQQAYVIGNNINKTLTIMSFSQRYTTTEARQEILDFIVAIKSSDSTDGKVTVHNCYHDVGGSCNSPEVIDEWGSYFAD